MPGKYILITGGAGFIGSNIAERYLSLDRPVHIFDNFDRGGVEQNVQELQRKYPRKLRITHADIRNAHEVTTAAAEASAIYHLAAQVAVTTSLRNPRHDFEVNVGGAINVLEAVRHLTQRPSIVFTSTNKVYGNLSSLCLLESRTRFAPLEAVRAGIDEAQPLEFLSPYGCSKGSADQYVLDYARSYGIPATVFRMSCIYGPYQRGSEDQGWVAHFLRQALKRQPITIYGNGKQVRDLLFVDDLVRAMQLAHENINRVAGLVFNVGGGPENSRSLLELLAEMRGMLGHDIAVDQAPERPADQRWYVSDASKINTMLGWRPEVGVADGLRRLHNWYLARPELIGQAEVQVA